MLVPIRVTKQARVPPTEYPFDDAISHSKPFQLSQQRSLACLERWLRFSGRKGINPNQPV